MVAAVLIGLALAGDPHADVRGMTVACPTWGWEWGTQDMDDALDQLAPLGVNWVAIHPYARISNDGSLGVSELDPPPEWITRPIREAHVRGMKIVIKPHIAYWGSRFSWRGEITFDRPAEWKRFFSDYSRWMVQLAKAAEGADAFVVGTELDLTVERPEWREIIEAVRAEQPGPLTYAANWNQYQRVPFWDALDVIGVQAYFPLAKHPGPASDEALDEAWAGWLDEIDRFGVAQRRKVVFTELGYPRTAQAAVRPWAYGDDKAHTELQIQLLQAGLRAVQKSDTVVGALLWKWMPGPGHSPDYSMKEPRVREALGDLWTAAGAKTPQAAER